MRPRLLPLAVLMLAAAVVCATFGEAGCRKAEPPARSEGGTPPGGTAAEEAAPLADLYIDYDFEGYWNYDPCADDAYHPGLIEGAVAVSVSANDFALVVEGDFQFTDGADAILVEGLDAAPESQYADHPDRVF